MGTRALSGAVVGIALAMLGAAACGGGGAAVVVPDAGDARGAGGAGGAGPRDAEVETSAPSPDAAPDVVDAAQPEDAAVDSIADAQRSEVAQEAGVDRAPDVVGGDATSPKLDAAADLKLDLPVEKPPASASWTIAPGPTCTAAGVGCMDTGTLGGYQVTASGACSGASSVQLWFPGGKAPLTAGTYAVKSASGILDVINMPAGMVGVLAEREEGAKHARYWGRAGSATVAVAGAGRRITLSGVTLREETAGTMTTLAVDGTCP
jgi:hypothetical protein